MVKMEVERGLLLTPRAALVARMVANLPAGQKTRVQSLDQEDTLGRRWQSTQYSCLGNPHEQKGPGGLQS